MDLKDSKESSISPTRSLMPPPKRNGLLFTRKVWCLAGLEHGITLFLIQTLITPDLQEKLRLITVWSQTPTKPVWPKAASASLFIEGWGEERRERIFVRWFYDETAGKERLDGTQRFEGELYFTNTILDATTQKEWFVVHQPGLVSCWVGAWNHSLPHPNFDNARFAGKAEIDYRVVNHWIERGPDGRDISQIYDRADNGQIVRIDFEDRRRRALSVHFHEFNAGTQDPSLWDLPAQIKNICNQIP